MATLKERFENLNLKEEIAKAREEFNTRVEDMNKSREEFITKVKDFKINDGVTKAREQADKLNAYALETTENALDTIFVNGEKWNGVATKAVNIGLKLSEKQMDLVFTTLEAVKEQVVEGTERFRGLFKKEENK